jgi:hypothetical protein
VAVTRVFRRIIKDPVSFRASLQRVGRWDFDRVIVSHGEIIEHDGKLQVAQALARAGFGLAPE